MREFKKIIIKQHKYVPKSITCNKCGEVVNLSDDDFEMDIDANKFHTFYTSFSYGSKYDGDTWNFDLCEKCLDNFVKTFKHLPSGFDEEVE